MASVPPHDAVVITPNKVGASSGKDPLNFGVAVPCTIGSGSDDDPGSAA